MKKNSNYISVALLVVFFIFLHIFNSTLTYNKPEDIQTGIVYEKAKVIKIISEDMGKDPEFDYIVIGKQKLELEILTGKNKGKVVTAMNFVERVDNKPAKVGTKFVVYTFDDFASTVISNYSRENSMYVLLGIFLTIVLIFGKIKGLKSIFSLGFTLVCVIYLFIPMILRGVEPILAAITVVILSTLVTLLSLNGWCRKTIIACISCILCTLFAGVIATIFGRISHISTLNTIEAENLLFIATNTSLKIKDLFFAGILIASVGAIMDTTISIASSLSELKELNPNIQEKQLLISGMNIGKDIMGTMTNTLILAFTGASINILIMLFMYNIQYIQLINLDMLVVEVIQGVSGSIAVVLSIPVTALLSAKILGASTVKELEI
ncbi:YibE/F family protein [Clostridium intestinale]|uniref:Uncharacterized membrane protein n=1 Tax=Clostridium intestinale DSM 6191 TaxID=1121320 RepID=A0A1M5XLP7_9CLOT|nr:YibE/F family protein [Clostridium intestinale]SHI00468.1 Uncharacterized membrane protein [Clostridium intestinale DSM 6191]